MDDIINICELKLECVYIQTDLAPEQRLWLNVLFKAYEDIRNFLRLKEYKHTLIANKIPLTSLFENMYTNEARYARSAASWVLSKDEEVYSFSWCLSICNKNYIKKGLRQLARQI